MRRMPQAFRTGKVASALEPAAALWAALRNTRGANALFPRPLSNSDVPEGAGTPLVLAGPAGFSFHSEPSRRLSIYA
jgi:hypothetical protein